MNPPMDEIELKLDEEKESTGPLFHCDLCDTDIVHKIAQAFLPGLASACIDNTTGGLFKSPATVAVDIRREMVDYLIQRSESFVAETVVQGGAAGTTEVSENPYDNISDFVDDFVTSKRNFFSRVSGWILSERREDWIDDLVQEMEINGFWLLSRRSSVAQTLLKNVDFKSIYHCSMSFKSKEDLEEHKLQCNFRTLSCDNEGCDSSFSAAQMNHHDSICPFKILQCEQHCSSTLMRREMDRHCITICPMKLVKCPFFSVGCLNTIPQCKLEEHRSENLQSHLISILQGFHKEASKEDLKDRVEEIKMLVSSSLSPGRLTSARDPRSLTIVIKDLDAKLGPIIPKPKENPPEDVVTTENERTGSPSIKNKDAVISPPKGSDSPIKMTIEEKVISPSKGHDSPTKVSAKDGVISPSKGQYSPTKMSAKDGVISPSKGKGSPTKVSAKDGVISPSKGKDSPTKMTVEDKVISPSKGHDFPTKMSAKDGAISPSKGKDSPTKMSAESQINKKKVEELRPGSPAKMSGGDSQANKEDSDNSHFVIQESLKIDTPPTLLHTEKDQVKQHSPTKVYVQMPNQSTEQEVLVQEHSTSPIKQEEKKRTIESATHENEASPRSPHGNRQSNKEGSRESPPRQEQTISLSSEAASRVKDDPKD